jgi:RecA/RadA recombinase
MPTGRILLCDFEGLDRNYVAKAIGASGFNGEVKIIEAMKKKKHRDDEDMMKELADGLLEETVSSGILDSVGSIQPRAEDAGDIGEAFIGLRAKAVAQFVRRTIRSLRDAEQPKALFVVNHVHRVIGGKGHSTVGGDVLKQLAAVRIWLYRKETGIFKDNPHDDFLAEGSVEKLRYGGKGRKFLVFFLGGHGVHPGLTAVFDCFRLGIAERDKTVKMGDKSYGYLRHLIAAAREGQTDPFVPFFEALRQV